jgi:hypothetical protein
MTDMQEESIRRNLSRMMERNFTRKEAIEILAEAGTPNSEDIQKLIDEYFPED